MRSSLLDRSRVHEHLHIMRSIFALAVYTLKHHLLRALIAEEKTFVQLLCYVIDTFIRAQDPLSNGLPDLVDQPVHIQILEHTRNDGVREKIRSSKREHETRCDAGQRLEKVGRVLHDIIGICELE